MLVIDNASVDDTATQAGEAGFEVHAMSTNSGFGAGCNAGLHLTKTDFILFCNPDVRPAPDSIAKLHGALTLNEQAAIAGALVESLLGHAAFLSFQETFGASSRVGYSSVCDEWEEASR